MANRLPWGFGRKPNPEPPTAVAPRPAPSVAASNGIARGAAEGEVQQAGAALELAQVLLRGVEHFVLSTPDLDVPGFMDRLRRIAARLTPNITSDELQGHQRWAADSLCTFGQLQRRYLSEREDELWRLLQLYQENQKVDGAANNQFNETLRGVHERLGSLVRLDDLRQVRERMETEIQRAGTLIEAKSRKDQERADALYAQVRQLEAALGEARDQATRDPLTGLFHRGAFEAQLGAALEAPTKCALAMMDVDNFKGINDTLGHLVGDEVLKLAVQLLGKVARPGDVIGRYGGDEFCLLSPGAAPERLAERFDRVTNARTLNFQFEQRLCSVRLSFSVGVAGSLPDDTPESITHRADSALLEAKRGGKGQAKVAPVPAPSR